MTTKSARSLFLDAVELPPERWSEYLDDVCEGDLELHQKLVRLLAAHQQVTGFMNQPAVEGSATAEQSREEIGSQIGPYELKEQIGEGGMGIVYVAEQKEPIRRFVALKVIKPGMDTKQVVARFEAERQTLAILDHPHIARVIDAGTTDQGRPYFVMELVRGVPITEFCDAERLTIRERLKLFCQVCEAVQHAHQKGIIHRDLKPSNVLVTRTDDQPIPKVIDFGIAKAVNQPLTEKTIYSQFAHVLGTPLYMSPEQAQLTGLDIDTRSDVYSLGVLLYELLTGTTPFASEVLREKGLDEFRRLVREAEPAQPSSRISTLNAEAGSTVSAKRGVDHRRLRHLMRGELDWIALRCLEKERNRRYQSASDVAADVQRYLDNEAVSACPPSNWYRFRKVVQRNRGVFAAGISIILALLIGFGVSLWQMQQANLARFQAESHRKSAEQAKIDADGHRKRAEQALKDADAQRKHAEAGYQYSRQTITNLLTRAAEAKLVESPGMRAFYLDLLNDAVSSYDQLITMNPKEPELYLERGRTYQKLEKNSNALQDFEKAVSLAPDSGEAQYRLGSVLVSINIPGDRERALLHLNRAIELAPQDAEFRSRKVTLLQTMRLLPEMRQEIDFIQANCEQTKASLRDIAYSLYLAGDHVAALPYAQRCAALDPDDESQGLTALGMVLASLGRDDEAMTVLTKSAEVFGRTLYRYNRHFPFQYRGDIYFKRKQYDFALADYDQQLKLRREPHVYKRHTQCHFHLGNYEQALADLESAMQRKPDDDSTLTWISPADVANCPDQDFRQGMLALMTKWIDSPNSLPSYHAARASLYLAMGKPELAQADLKIALVSPKASPTTWNKAAMAALAARDTDGYQQTAHEMIERFRETTDFSSMTWTVWTAVVAPGGVSRDAELLVIAKGAVTQQPTDFNALQILGALYFRLGAFDAAKEQLEASEEAIKADMVGPAAAYAWYFLAMTEHNLGNPDAAQEWLAKASEYRENALREEANSTSKIPWNRKLTMELLDAETKAMVKPRETPESPTQR